MKNLLTLIFILSFYCCTDNNGNLIDNSSNEYLEITNEFSLQEFENIKNFVIEKGGRQTYSNMYNNNPHFSFKGFEAYLNPEIGQKNINCDPTISDFNEITLRDIDAKPQYYTIHIVRQGDSGKKDVVVSEGMKDGKVYLLNPYDDDIDLMKKKLIDYIEAIKMETNNH